MGDDNDNSVNDENDGSNREKRINPMFICLMLVIFVSNLVILILKDYADLNMFGYVSAAMSATAVVGSLAAVIVSLVKGRR